MKAQNEQLKERRRPRRYDAEFKANAIGLVESGRSVASVAAALGIDKSLLYAWRRQHARKQDPELEKEVREREQMRRRILELEQECEILKKALAIFSRRKAT